MRLIQPFPSGCGNIPCLLRCAFCEGRNHSLRRTSCIHRHLAATHRTGQVLTGPNPAVARNAGLVSHSRVTFIWQIRAIGLLLG